MRERCRGRLGKARQLSPGAPKLLQIPPNFPGGGLVAPRIRLKDTAKAIGVQPIQGGGQLPAPLKVEAVLKRKDDLRGLL